MKALAGFIAPPSEDGGEEAAAASSPRPRDPSAGGERGREAALPAQAPDPAGAGPKGANFPRGSLLEVARLVSSLFLLVLFLLPLFNGSLSFASPTLVCRSGRGAVAPGAGFEPGHEPWVGQQRPNSAQIQGIKTSRALLNGMGHLWGGSRLKYPLGDLKTPKFSAEILHLAGEGQGAKEGELLGQHGWEGGERGGLRLGARCAWTWVCVDMGTKGWGSPAGTEHAGAGAGERRQRLAGS